MAVLATTALVYGALEVYDKYVATLPFYGPVTTDSGEQVHHRVEDFTMLDQNGRKVTLAVTEGKISVVNFFFTSCPTICPTMMRNLQSVHELYLNDPQIAILSFTVDPSRDTPARLAKYAEAYHMDAQQWRLLTGNKREIYRLARNSYYLSASQGDGGEHDFIHSENLVLIDRDRRIRGYYNGTDEKAVAQLIQDITKLKREAT